MTTPEGMRPPLLNQKQRFLYGGVVGAIAGIIIGYQFVRDVNRTLDGRERPKNWLDKIFDKKRMHEAAKKSPE